MTVIDVAGSGPLRSVLVCHREPLVAAAAAAVLESRHVTRRASTATSLTGALSGLAHGVDLAVVCDGADEEVTDLFEAIRHRGIRTPVVVVSESADPDYGARILEAGAAGLLPARCAAEELCGAALTASRGHVVIVGRMRGEVLGRLRVRRALQHDAQAHLAGLTPVDITILRMLSDGLTVSRIGARLSVSPHTVRGRVRVIGAHLGVAGQLRIAAAGRRLLAAAGYRGRGVTVRAPVRSGGPAYRPTAARPIRESRARSVP